ncbi:MAG: glycosyltransferase family 4 protein [Chloroflexi bacterium]|nr:glycosyltransferase family 4 protein [Chloroflexota bacterium]
MEVVISVGDTFWAYHVVRAALQAGYLKRFLTTRLDRAELRIDRRMVREIRAPDLIGRGIRRIAPLNRLFTWNWVKDNLFDLLASRHVPDSDIFHVWTGYGLHSLRKARDRGARIVVERGSTHPLTQQQLMAEEYERWNVPPPTMVSRWTEKQVAELAEADQIIIPSEFVRRSMIENGVPEGKLVQIPYGVDLQRFQPADRSDDVFRVLFAGAVSLRKGIPYLLDAIDRLDRPDIELVIVGYVTEDAHHIVSRYRDRRGFRFIGPVRQHDLPRYYQASSVFVLPSIEEGSARVTYEAMACGLPSIVTPHVGSIIQDGVEGFTVPIRDPDAIADRLEKLYRDGSMRRTMGRAAHHKVQSYTWQRYSSQVIGTYERLADEES